MGFISEARLCLEGGWRCLRCIAYLVICRGNEIYRYFENLRRVAHIMSKFQAISYIETRTPLPQSSTRANLTLTLNLNFIDINSQQLISSHLISSHLIPFHCSVNPCTLNWFRKKKEITKSSIALCTSYHRPPPNAQRPIWKKKRPDFSKMKMQ